MWGNGFPSQLVDFRTRELSLQLVDCRTREPGVLILSPFAGAGGMMHEALLVNPYEVDACVYNIHKRYRKRTEYIDWRGVH